ncbi:hypothetical protein [Sphingomonas sp. R86521]|uniref:hypothetical protein n=1 Tax=Sphingomonas sp. R86521 TaxID=3093860 RepID=UPI0036D2D38F
MPRTFVDALADSIVRQLLQEGDAALAVASSRGVDPPYAALAGLDPPAIDRVASAIAGHLIPSKSRNALPLEAIEI